MSALRNFLILAVLVLATAAATWVYTAVPPSSSPQPVLVRHDTGIDMEGLALPDFSFTTITGESYNSTAFDGKVMIVNFWASWCAPCIYEFPMLLELAARFDDDAVVVFVSNDRDIADITRFMEQFERRESLHFDDYPNIYIFLDEDTQITRQLFGIYRLPETIITDRDHKMQRKLVGVNWSVAAQGAFIESLLADTP